MKSVHACQTNANYFTSTHSPAARKSGNLIRDIRFLNTSSIFPPTLKTHIKSALADEFRFLATYVPRTRKLEQIRYNNKLFGFQFYKCSRAYAGRAGIYEGNN